MSEADTAIQQCIEQRKSFVLDAGAGSGKTYSLAQALRYLCGTKRGEMSRAGQSIACITYTNAARDEITERTGAQALIRASTIHDFLWHVIQPHQNALKAALIKFNLKLDAESSRKKDDVELREALVQVPVTYSDTGSNFLEGRLHHDDLLSVAHIVFTDNPFLSRLVAAKYPYVLVDEYQDASMAVINILLACLLPANPDDVVVGLFGDQLQNIFHGGEHPGVGEIPAPLLSKLTRIPKGENHRCSVAVIQLLNRIRTDIEQYPMDKNVEGSAIYLRMDGDATDALARARHFVATELRWSSSRARDKELYLTHRLIAKKAGYDGVLEVFTKRGSSYRDRLLNGEDRRIAFFLDRVEPLAEAWSANNSGRTLSILRASGYEFSRNQGKKAACEALDQFIRLRDKATIRAVLEHIRDARLFPLLDEFTDRLAAPIDAQRVALMDSEAEEREAREWEFYTGFFGLTYDQVRSYTAFFNEHTPFATKHGVKGKEFDTVFVVLNDKGANWNLYSFDKYLSGEDASANPARFRRTRNVFYVCCSRAIRNLAVVDLGKQYASKRQGAEALFGVDRCFRLE